MWKSNYYCTTWLCVFVALGTQHAMLTRHIVICGLTRSTILSTLSHTRTITEKKIYCKLNVFWFSLQILSETFFILGRTERDMIKMCICLHVKYRYSCQILMKIEFSRWIFEKYSKIEFHENPINGSRVIPCGRKDRYEEAKSLFSQFWGGRLKILDH